MSIRIKDLDEVTSLSGYYVAVDSSSGGTKKYDATELGSEFVYQLASVYSTSSTYAIGQFCIYDGDLYMCNTTISSGESWNSGHWTAITVGTALYTKVDKISGKGLSTNDFTNAYLTKLEGIESGAEVNVQSDWSVTDSSSDAYIANKPTEATTSTTGLMSASDKTKLDGIATGAEVNVQADWSETDSSADDYILNKPESDTTLETSGDFADSATVGNALFDTYSTSATYALGDCVKYQGTMYVCTTEITTAESWTSGHWTAMNIGNIFEAIVSGDEDYALYHLGFYLDENGDVCQVED